MDRILRKTKKLIPKKVFSLFQHPYHYGFALIGAALYGYPSKEIKVVMVTGTKGKSSTVEFINAMLESAGKKTALISTIRFKIAEKTWPNKFKMTTPGRLFIQKFLRESVTAHCEYIILEMSSEAAKQYRHKFIDIDTLVFTNISPEHIQSHGSFEKYLKAKLSLAKALEKSPKRGRIIVANADDPESEKFLAIHVPVKVSYKIEDVKPFELKDTGSIFTLFGQQIHTVLPGKFNLYNILAAANYAFTQGVSLSEIKKAIEHLEEIKGRVQKIQAGQNFTVVVDYAHTPDSLKNLYETFPESQKICVLSNTGGGRDTWKRPEMARIADTYCDEIILTDEDPYDDNPEQIVEEMRVAIKNKPVSVVMNRRNAIHTAIEKAYFLEKKSSNKITVLISGKGSDPYIIRKDGSKEPWSDADVAKEEILKVLNKTS